MSHPVIGRSPSKGVSYCAPAGGLAQGPVDAVGARVQAARVTEIVARDVTPPQGRA